MSEIIRASRHVAVQTWLVRSALMVLAVAAATMMAPAIQSFAGVADSSVPVLTLSSLK